MEDTIMKRSVKKLVVCGIIALMVCALCSLVAFAAADKPEPAPQDGTSVSQEAETNSAADSTGSKAIAAKRPSQSGTDEKNDANQIKKPSRRRFFYLKIVTYFDTKCTPLTTFR